MNKSNKYKEMKKRIICKDFWRFIGKKEYLIEFFHLINCYFNYFIRSIQLCFLIFILMKLKLLQEKIELSTFAFLINTVI